MKLVVIAGPGTVRRQVADEFARLNQRARLMLATARLILVDAFAVNSDNHRPGRHGDIKADHHHRILIGAGVTRGHWRCQDERGWRRNRPERRRQNHGYLRRNPRLFESDAFLLITPPPVARLRGQPIIARMSGSASPTALSMAIAVLPFEHEEENEERAVFNTAGLLKSLSEVTDAIILVDNQRYVGKDVSVSANIQRINQLIAEPFFSLLCAGEGKKPKTSAPRPWTPATSYRPWPAGRPLLRQLLKPIIPCRRTSRATSTSAAPSPRKASTPWMRLWPSFRWASRAPRRTAPCTCLRPP
jgi:hypothetical protein